MDINIYVYSTFAAGIILLYMLYAPFRYNVRMFLFLLYTLVVIGIVSLPVLLYNWRCTKNLLVISRMMDPARFLFRIRSEIRHRENMIQNEPCVIVSNHQCLLDVLGMAELYPPRSSFMSKYSLLFAGPLGLALWLSGGIFVNRSKHKRPDAMLKHVSDEVVRRKLQLWIFPEGTRNGKRGMLPFKKGAFNIAVMGKLPIVPVVFKSYEDFYSKDEHKFEPGKYVAEILPPVKTEGLTLDDVPNLSNKIRDQMLETYNRLSGYDQ